MIRISRFFYSKDDLINVNIDRILKESDKAVLIEYCGQKIWLPKKEIRIVQKGDDLIVKVPKWLHEKRFF